MTVPTPAEAWRQFRAQGIGVDAAERLRLPDPLRMDWFPQTRWDDQQRDVKGHRFAFRLHLGPDGWLVEGTDGVGPWEVCEGPIVDSGRPPWLARPKDIAPS